MSDIIARRAPFCVAVIALSMVVVGAQSTPQSPQIAPDLAALASQLLSAGGATERSALLEARGGASPEIVSALQAEGDRRYSEGQYAAAADGYRAAIEVSEKTGDQRATGLLWQWVGDSLRQAERLDEADQAYTRSREILGLIGDENLVASITHSFGVLRRRQGRYDEARSLYLAAVAAYRRLGAEGDLASTLSSLAIVVKAEGDYPSALAYHLEGVEIMRRINHADLAVAISNLGAYYKDVSDGVNAELLYREALQLARTNNDRPGEALVLSNLGSIQVNHGDPAEAFRTLQESFKIYDGLKLSGRAATVINIIGALRLRQGNLEQAEAYFLESFRIRESLKNPSAIASSLHNLASVYREQGRFAEAHVLASRALGIRETIGEKALAAATHRRIGTIFIDEGRLDDAARSLGRARDIAEAIGNRLEISRTLQALAIVAQRRGRDQEVIEFSRRAALMARELSQPDFLWPALTLEAGAVARSGNRQAALSLLNEAITAVEDLRWQAPGGEQDRQLFFQGKVHPYYELARLQFEARDWRAALAAAERAKARVLRDVLEGGRVNVTASMTEREKADEEQLRLKLVSINAQTAIESQRTPVRAERIRALRQSQREARLAFDGFRTNLYSRHAALSSRRAEEVSVDLTKAAAALPPGTAAVEFVVGDDRTLAFVVRRSTASESDIDVSAYEVPIARAALAARVESFRKSIADRSLGFRRESRGLFELLLGPAGAQLASLDTLIIVPDGTLWTLPFQALQTTAGRFLLEEAAVAYAPSLSVLIATHDATAAPRATASEILVVAGMDGQGGVATPGAARLTSRLRTIYGQTSRALTGAQADESAVKTAMPRFDVVHFSGHGVLDGENPMNSHLQLARNATDDGLLEARELMQLDLKASVIVLAACETALGRVGAGEGIVGLSWAGFIAGSATTVVSQWKVDAESTTDLMIEFHRRLAAGRHAYLSVARSVRQAALPLLRSPATDHPFYWAGFTVVGRP